MRALFECLVLFLAILGAYVLVAMIDGGFFDPSIHALSFSDVQLILHRGF